MRLRLTMILLSALANNAALAQTVVGSVTQVQGSATLTRGAAAQELLAGAAILADDILETGAASKLLVTFADGTKLTLGPDADVVVDEFVYGGPADNAILTVAKGAVRVLAGALEDRGAAALQVRTPVATIGIRGTDFFIEMIDRQHLAVALFSGQEIVVGNEGGSTTLKPGEGTDVWGAGAPSEGFAWGYERINRALGLVTLTPSWQRPLAYLRPIAPEATIAEAFSRGLLRAEGRLRYEHVDQASRPRAAFATTARLRLGYETAAWNGWFAGIEGEITRTVFGERRSDGAVTRPGVPVISDPDSEELNQAYVGWTMPAADGLPVARAIAGRHRIGYDNERWVGPGAFRQNDQTLDAVSIEGAVGTNLSYRYAYVDRVNRILGNNPNGRWQSDSHMAGVSTNLIPYGLTTAYAYVLDLKPVPQFSSASYGIRYEAAALDPFGFGLEAEIARQRDHAANPRDFSLTYALIRPSVRFEDTTFFAGWEWLGGDGVSALQTPLATLHRHNGFADVFSVTPPDGLRDLHLRVLQELPDAGPLKNLKLDLRYHDFRAARKAGGDYGDEFDADVNGSVLGLATVGVRYAHYNAHGFDADTEKVWVYVEVQY